MNPNWRTHELTFPEAAAGHSTSLQAQEREWLLTNGSGAYAMGTVPGVNTRRYHGLLIGALHPPVRRIVALHQVLEQVVIFSGNSGVNSGGGSGGTSGGAGQSALTHDLTTCLFRGGDGNQVHHPQGHARLAKFERGLSVKWTYLLPGLEVSRELHLHWKEQAITLRYHVKPLERFPHTTIKPVLRLSPFLTLRDFHSVAFVGGWYELHADGSDTMSLKLSDAKVTLRCQPGDPEQSPAKFHRNEDWWRGFFYPKDSARGQEDREDWLIPGTFELPLDLSRGSAQATLTCALGDHAAHPANDDDAGRAAHLAPLHASLRKNITAHAASPRAVTALTIASDDFIVDRRMKGQKLSTVMAGYPWFYDWGRDTFIALPGLLLAPGTPERLSEARAVLEVFASAIKDGLVPNRFDDYHDTAAHYNTVDASLWYVHAALEYTRISGDRESWHEWLADACLRIVDAYEAGTGDPSYGRFGKPMIWTDDDGLVSAGSPCTQLTWMDAACGGTVFTPRHGKAVEINALWHHVLVGLSDALDKSNGAVIRRLQRLAAKVRRSFNKAFWDEERQCLIDHLRWDDDHQWRADLSLRPNQIFAASLENSPLTMARRKAVLAAVTRDLLTPFGLRTLPPSDYAYHPWYFGPQYQRDEAYHQGTVWPWLIGPYAEAVLRTGSFSPASKRKAAEAISGLIEFMLGPGQGQLFEIHEANLPHRPDGCIAQAWSIAEVLRIATLISSNAPAAASSAE